MDNDPVYQYLALFLENLSVWPVLIVGAVWWLVKHPALFEKLPDYFSRLKIGSVEVELREVKAKLEETQQQVSELENEIELEKTRYDELLAGFDPHAPLSDLAKTREALKAMAPSMDDLSPVRQGLSPEATPEEVYAAAEILRTRRDSSLFDDLVSCLDRLAGDPDLHGIRLHTVWTLTSALHRTLIADIKHNTSRLSAEQLMRAQAMLVRLTSNPRVLADRPEEPLKGVHGLAKWANDWIKKGLQKLAESE
jgi:hypothetical protein